MLINLDILIIQVILFKSEFCAASISSEIYQNEKKLNEAFFLLDTNKNGIINLEDI